jgi:hypothetical protein
MTPSKPQSRRPFTMRHAVTLACFAAAIGCGAAQAVDVYKWKDSQGRVHYGDRPASGVDAATMSVPGGGDTPEEQAAAEASLEADRQRLQQRETPSRGDRSPYRRPVQPPAESGCAASWRRFDAAQACFIANRVAGGKGVSGDGVAGCRDVPQPGCSR